MPEIIIINDDASFISSSAASLDIAQQPFHIPPRQLRRQKTVTQLRRWVSKRISRSSLIGSAHNPNELSEKNLYDHHITMSMGEEDDISVNEPANSGQPWMNNACLKPIATIAEDTNNDSPKGSLKQDRKSNTKESYAAFCRRFTMSGPPQVKRPFTLVADSRDAPFVEEPSTTNGPPLEPGPSSEGSQQSDRISSPGLNPMPSPGARPEEQAAIFEAKIFDSPGADDDILAACCLQPPPQVMTPFKYMEMHHATREQKRVGKQKVLGSFHSLLARYYA